MQLCKHIKIIYQSEIKKGNSIVYLTKWNDFLIVYFKNKIDLSSVPSNVVFRIQNDPHYAKTREYICTECHCSICGPAENTQYGWCKRDHLTLFNEGAIATPETIEVKDELWNHFPPEIVPKFVGFEDKYKD
jgi:hypothetical protein